MKELNKAKIASLHVLESPVSPGDVFVQLNCHNNSGNTNSLGRPERPIIKTAGPSFKSLAAKEDVSSIVAVPFIRRTDPLNAARIEVFG